LLHLSHDAGCSLCFYAFIALLIGSQDIIAIQTAHRFFASKLLSPCIMMAIMEILREESLHVSR
jgi:hypothetical protein